MKFRLSRKAVSDLSDIWNYSNKMWGSEKADSYLDALEGRIRWLTVNRSLWRQRDEISKELYDFREGRHLIFFREYAKGIEIVRVLHERMDLKHHL